MAEVEEKSVEMFLVDNFDVIKRMISFTSFPSKTYLYQMPYKAEDYVDGTVDKASELMNTLLDYHRQEDWRVEEYTYASEWEITDNKLSINLVSKKSRQQITLSITGIKLAIVVPDLHSITLVVKDPVFPIAPNVIVRLVGLIQHKFSKCILVGEDDPEHKGQRVLSMKFEPIATTAAEKEQVKKQEKETKSN